MRLLVAAFLVLVSPAMAQTPVAAGPTVGDPIAVDLDLRPGERAELAPLEGVEIVAQNDGGVTVRGFRPGTHVLQFLVTGEGGTTREISRAIEISSVLHADDDLQPAPLAPPVPLGPNRTSWIAIGLAAFGAVAVWLYLLWMPRTRGTAPAAGLSASEELLRAIERVRRMSPSDERFATLSDAARQFLARVDPRLGRELTTSEVMERLHAHFPGWLISDVRDVLSEGDYAKFSPWGGRAARFESVLQEAADLAVLDRERKPS